MEMESKKHGEYTGILGDRLFDDPFFENNSLFLAADHGSKSKGIAIPYLGRSYTSATNLSHLDIAIIDLMRPHRAILVCEIEEEKADPKKIIGDLFNIYMANYLSVRHDNIGEQYTLKNASIILGIRSSENSPPGKKAKNIVRKLSKMLSEEVKAGKKIHLVFGQEYDELIRGVEKKINKITKEYLRQRNILKEEIP